MKNMLTVREAIRKIIAEELRTSRGGTLLEAKSKKKSPKF